MRRPASARGGSRRIFPLSTVVSTRSLRRSGTRRFGGSASASDCAIGVNWRGRAVGGGIGEHRGWGGRRGRRFGAGGDFTDAGEEGGVVIGLAVEGELTEPEPEELDAEGEAACAEGEGQAPGEEVAIDGWTGASAETKGTKLGRGTTPGLMSCVRRCSSAGGEGSAAEVAPVEVSDNGRCRAPDDPEGECECSPGVEAEWKSDRTGVCRAMSPSPRTRAC
ncbi:hypothetical protein FB451DRAFT_1369276 [Mycena latifolia]|nr:hypothetical protein FB451DRAFT_1369276 [Mycena latifolia]